MARTKLKSPYSVHPGVAMVQSWLVSLPDKTGHSLDEWIRLVDEEGPPSDKERRDWLGTHTPRGRRRRPPRVSLLEYKSPGRPYRAGNLDRLWGYVHTHFANERGKPRTRADGTELSPGMEGAPDVWTRADLCAVLVVPGRTPSLDGDVEAMGLAWEDLGGGYWQVTGGRSCCTSWRLTGLVLRRATICYTRWAMEARHAGSALVLGGARGIRRRPG